MKVPREYMSRYRKLNRKLIPANIILLVLALVACLTQLFMPLITIKVELPEGSVADLVRTIAGAQDEEENEDEDASAVYMYALADETDTDSGQGEELEADTDGDDGTDGTSGGTGDIVAYALDFLDKLDAYFGYMPGFSFKVSFSPLSLVRNIGKDIDAFAEWFASLFPTEEKMEELAVDVFSPMIAGLVNTEIILMMNGNIINTKFAKLLERTEDDIVAVFTDLAEGDATGAEDAFNAYLLKLGRLVLFGTGREGDTEDTDYDAAFDAALSMELTEDQQAQLEEYIQDYLDIFNEIISAGETDESGTFSMSEAVAGFFDYELSAYGLESAEITGTITSFLTDPHSFMETEIVQILQDTGIEDFLEEAGFGFNALMITLFVVFCAFPAALWAIMAIAAFRRLFSKNKKVGMWYTKLCCIWPCILFFILPCVLLAVLPGYLGMEGLFASVSVAIGGSGIVTGICYLLMWAVSIFMCFPTKRKLRRLKAEMKASRR